MFTRLVGSINATRFYAAIYLRSHAVCAAAYSLIKKRLVLYAPEDVEFYNDIRDPVFDIIMEGANEWATASHWSQPVPDLA
jgi:hypothetical protein